MPYKMSWYYPSRIVLVEVIGDVDSSELSALGEELNRFLNEGQSPIHVITDARNLGSFPTKAQDVRNALKNLEAFGIDIIVGFKNPIAKFLATVMSRLSNFEVRLVDDMEQAENTLRRLDPTLEDPSPSVNG